MSQKLAIVTAKAQTTRNKIIGIKNTENEQIIFVDTNNEQQRNTYQKRYYEIIIWKYLNLHTLLTT